MSKQAEHTALPWRIGDAGLTVFGPKTSAPSPKTVAHSNRADTAYIVRACNAHETLVSALATLNTWLIAPATDEETIRNMREMIHDALKLAQGEQP